MTYEQTATLTTLISAAQGISFANESKIVVWHSLLEDLNYEKAHLALKKLLRTEKYNITPAHIREACSEFDSNNNLTADALMILNTAIRRFGHYNALEAMEYIKNEDDTVYEIVRAIGFKELCMGNPNFMRPEFERLYSETARCKRQNDLLPVDVKLAICEFKNRLSASNLAALAIECD